MGAGKYPYLRYRVIHSCLSSRQKKYWSLEEIQEKLREREFVVQKRSLERDLETMRHDPQLAYHAPIAYDRQEKGYYYTDPDYKLDHIPLTHDDFQTLSTVSSILQPFKGSRVVHEFESLIDKLSRCADYLKRQEDRIVLDFENSPFRGLQHFDFFLDAVSNKQVLRVTYCQADGKPATEHIFHSYLLKEFEGCWYVTGYCTLQQKVIALNLNRIVNIVRTTLAFCESESVLGELLA